MKLGLEGDFISNRQVRNSVTEITTRRKVAVLLTAPTRRDCASCAQVRRVVSVERKKAYRRESERERFRESVPTKPPKFDC